MKCVDNLVLEQNKSGITSLVEDVMSGLANISNAHVTYYRANQYYPESKLARQIIIKFENGTELQVELKGDVK